MVVEFSSLLNRVSVSVCINSTANFFQFEKWEGDNVLGKSLDPEYLVSTKRI
jgi:hypothetical protein